MHDSRDQGMRLYHVWFSTKGRKAALEGEVGEDVKRMLSGIAQRASIELLEIEVAVDHAHLLLALRTEQTLASAMHQLKGATSRLISLKYPEVKADMRAVAFWQKGYGWRELDASQVPLVRDYIRTQQDRPLRHAH